MPLKEHSFPAVAITRDVAEDPPPQAASPPVGPIADQIGRDVHRQRSGQFLVDKIFVDRQQLVVDGLFCDRSRWHTLQAMANPAS